jgi:NAD(P)-dependent dehydrogenase (short-subunit alcohol dehydrogenase family)
MQHGVTINAFAPGIFTTPGMIEAELHTLGHSEETFEGEMTVAGTTTRMGRADEMAAMVLFLCSPAARYVSGASIIADGASSQSNWVNVFEPGEM